MGRIPIVRTEGKVFADGSTLTPERMVREPYLLRTSKTDATRAVEAAFALGNSLYFFAGHACPDFGQMVFVYHPEWSVSEPGGATPFDTGGLFHGYIKWKSHEDAATYCAAFRVDLSGWVSHFDAYLQHYFSSDRSYVLGECAVIDDPTGRLLHPANKRRAWTWELQIHRDWPLLENLALLCVPSEIAEALRREIRTLPDDEASRWLDFLSSSRFRVAPPGTVAPLVCSMAEEEISTWL